MDALVTAAVLAHQGGWDEALFVAVPMTVLVGLLWLAQKRAADEERADEERADEERADEERADAHEADTRDASRADPDPDPDRHPGRR